MIESLRLKLILSVFILLFILQSCAGIKNQGSSENPVQLPVSPERPVLMPVSPERPVQTQLSSERPVQESANIKHTAQAPSQAPVQVANLAQKHIEAGEYQNAIDIYNYECRKQPRDLHLIQMYAKSLDGIKSVADNALEKKDFAYAGRIYYVLQRNYAKFNNFVKKLSFNGAYLNTKLSYCKKSLSVQGFQEYREGHLNSALVSWQGVLDIDPNNKEIKDAVRTAKLQQKNLP